MKPIKLFDIILSRIKDDFKKPAIVIIPAETNKIAKQGDQTWTETDFQRINEKFYDSFFANEKTKDLVKKQILEDGYALITFESLETAFDLFDNIKSNKENFNCGVILIDASGIPLDAHPKDYFEWVEKNATDEYKKLRGGVGIEKAFLGGKGNVVFDEWVVVDGKWRNIVKKVNEETNKTAFYCDDIIQCIVYPLKELDPDSETLETNPELKGVPAAGVQMFSYDAKIMDKIIKEE